MQPASLETIKTELKQLPPKQVLELLLRLTRFKKDNKELLSYLLFESGDEEQFIKQIKAEANENFAQADGLSAYLLKKRVRKIQRLINKQIKYMGSKTATAELYLFMAESLRAHNRSIFTRSFLDKTILQYKAKLDKLLPGIEEDLRHDLSKRMDTLG